MSNLQTPSFKLTTSDINYYDSQVSTSTARELGSHLPKNPDVVQASSTKVTMKRSHAISSQPNTSASSNKVTHKIPKLESIHSAAPNQILINPETTQASSTKEAMK